MWSLYLISTVLHIVAAAVWIGGMVVLVAALLPVLRRGAYGRCGTEVLEAVAVRFRTVGWLCLGVLGATGLFQLFVRGLWPFRGDGLSLGASPFGGLAVGKLLVFGLILTVSALHDFRVGPRATALGRRRPDAPETRRLRRCAAWLGRANLVLALVALALGVFLVRGLP